MSNETKAFHLLCDKPNSSEISSTCLCPTSDLVAVLTLDGEVGSYEYFPPFSKVLFLRWKTNFSKDNNIVNNYFSRA